MEKRNRGEIWFAQDGPWQRAYPVHQKAWAAGAVFIALFFAIVAFFISLEPFTPLNYGLLFLWWLAVIGLMVGFHLFARSRTDRRWLSDAERRR
jgi:hypothetical protein